MSIFKTKFWRLLKRIFLWAFVLQLVYILFCKWFNPPITITQMVNVFKGYGLKRDYISYNKMGNNIKLAVMAGEDQLFPDHNGFDMKSIKKAMAYNEKNPRKQRGASTISQQTAKNIFLWQGGGFFRKGLEVYFTFMIELLWSKERILEAYLNVAEMGPGIFGVEAASQAYFNKKASMLSRQEAAMIAACLPNPKRLKVKPASRYIQRRSAVIMRYMNNLQGDAAVKKILD